ncbi:MAG: pyruvate carboxylase [Eubacterium sp.]|nr:pyruvate carboxylase [Eubacterium sp.]
MPELMKEIRKFKKVLVANRGEIALRVFRALNELGITSVAIYSKEDKYGLFRSRADEAYQLDPTKGPVDAYLDIPTIINIAKERKVDAIHPGYGFLSENPDFVRACEAAGITFIGPSAELMERMGDKISAKKVAIDADVPIIPGVEKPVDTAEEANKIAKEIGYPVMLKASNGGGGRGMRIVNSEEEMEKEFNEAAKESRKAFGKAIIFVEKYLRSPKHIEVQILGDNYGNIVHLYDRDCSVQRRHQKVVEYAPAFSIPQSVREKMFDSSKRLASYVGYRNAGTLEFLVDADFNPYFIEMNPRVQVEHTCTEMVTDIDIVVSQILIAEGYALNSKRMHIYSQNDIHCNGYALQTRITTEDPANQFVPDYGQIDLYRSANGNGVRLDGGNAYEGAQITPYYDSLLVKAITHDRTFEDTIRKSLRVLKEFQIHGVKTNIPFLINVLTNETFQEGRAFTTFIEETPELFTFHNRQDRETAVLEFLSNKMVNVNPGPKPEFQDRIVPEIDESVKIWGAKDEFKKLGARDFTQKILKEKKLYITDTTMRDAQQSLMATRMRTKDIVGAARAANQFLANAFSVEAWGGATYDTAYRFLKESPWTRLEYLKDRMPNTLIQMLLRASNAVGYSNYPDNVVKTFIKVAARNGIDVFRIFDSLNWVENMKMPIEEALKTGKIVEGALCYTGDILSPNEKKYTLDYYVRKAKELESLGIHTLAIKDMAALLKPYAAKELVTALKQEVNIPIHLHTHDSTGNGVATVLMAAEAGVDIVDCAIGSMSSMTSQPSLNSVVEALRGTERDTGLDPDQLNILDDYYENVRKVYQVFESGMKAPKAEIYKYEIPGGQYSNLLAQVKGMGAGEHFGEIKKLYKEANELLGNIVKVTPSSKVVGDFAIFMFKNNLNKDNILTEGKDLSYPDSVVSYFQGMIGQPEGGFPKELQKIVLKDKKAIKVRPGSLLPAEDFAKIEKLLKEKYYQEKMEDPAIMEQKVISYALYPKVYEDYCEHFQAYNDVSRLESHVYFYGLREGEETKINVGEGKELLIKFVRKGEVDEEGYRTLQFEVNGFYRQVRILDKNFEVKEDHHVKAEKDNKYHLGASIPGTVGDIFVKEGDTVKVNQPLLSLEAMKMETTVLSTMDGTVDIIYVKSGDTISTEDLLISFKEEK